MRKKRVLICGATGFIGRNIAEAFMARGDYDLYGTYCRSNPLEDPRITMLHADLTRTEDVERVVRDKDIIIQAAATTSGANEIVNRPYYHVTDNAVMNSLIFRAAHEHAVAHVVFFSCTLMYQSGDVPVREDDFDANREFHPRYFGAGWTKVYIEKMCQFYSGIGSTKYTAIRHSNIYGPYDKFDPARSHVFGATVTKVMTAKDGKITVWGSGEEERDLLYVSDLVNFVSLAIERQQSRFGLYNAGYGSSIPVSRLVEKIIRHSGRDLKIEYDPERPTIKTKLCLDSARAHRELGWSPGVTLDEGIRKTIGWYRANIAASEEEVAKPC